MTKNNSKNGRELMIAETKQLTGNFMSLEEYDVLVYQKLLIASVNRGMSDAESGAVFTTDELRKKLRDRRAERHLRSRA